MRYEQALDIICGAGYLPNSCEEVCVKALEKQVPKEVTERFNNKYSWNCPSCRMNLNPRDTWKYAYCPYCGQALVWSEWIEESEEE